MKVKPITIDGRLDHLFEDDRDERIEGMSVKDRIPSYGSNDLYRPSRALSSEEGELANRIGTKKFEGN